jgi:two-component system, sensor histidine kinase
MQFCRKSLQTGYMPFWSILDGAQGQARMQAAATSQIMSNDQAGHHAGGRAMGGDDSDWAERHATGDKAKAPLIAAEFPTARDGLTALCVASFYALAAAAVLLPHGAGAMTIGLWPPNAGVVALLLLSNRIGNEWLVLAGVLAASFLVQVMAGFGPANSAVLAVANAAEISLAVAFTRRLCGPRPRLSRIAHLSRFIWAGGIVAPTCSALLASLAMNGALHAIANEALTWLLTGSMAMLLIVPTALVLFERPTRPAEPLSLSQVAEVLLLLIVGMVCAFLVFRQSDLPLLFLIQPITLLHAFRLGSRGTAVYVLSVAAIASGLTWHGLGPIAEATPSGFDQMLLLQLFITANFLTGLPVAAILASRSEIMARLADRKRQLDMLADNIGDAVLHYDLARVCTYASPSVRDVVGVAPELMLGLRIDARLHPETAPEVSAAIERIYSGQSEHERLTYRRSTDHEDGSAVFLEADCRVTRDAASDAATGVVAAVRDITERVELESLLTHAREEAEQAAQVKSDFLANMSHEIRTPMNGVLGFAEMMLQGDLEPDQRRYAELIVHSGRSMMMLLNDILDLSKIEAGQFTIDEGPVDLHATLAECAALHRPDAQRKGIELLFECECGDSDGHSLDDSLRHWIMSDGLRLRQIVLNLLSNAVKFTEAGSIRLSYRLDDDAIRICVADTGIGIRPERLSSVFAPFHQIDGAGDRQIGGTGLGLSISRKLADLLGGNITLESEVARGSVFTLHLPAKLIAPQPRAAAQPDVTTALSLPPSARILLAEDHDVNRLLMVEMLERCGQSVAIAYDGTEAISMVMDSIIRGRPYDLVLMDVQMPGCDGYAATRAIRAEGICADVLPIVALTANAFPGDIANARASGMQAHLAKPVMMADLARTLQRWLPTRIVDASRNERRVIGRTPSAADGAPPPPMLGWEQWIEHRARTVTAISAALRKGRLAGGGAQDQQSDKLHLMIHNLAGAAANFGETLLGLRAAALDEALRKKASRKECEDLARELLAVVGTPASEPENELRSAR